MELTLLVVRLVLAATFATAGIAKLADRAGSQRAVTEFGLPVGLAAPVGFLLPCVELAVAIALVPATTARAGAAGALVLLAVFMIAIAANMARGRRPDCHCFGQVHSAPAGWTTLFRNAVLAAGAIAVIVSGPGLTVAGGVDRVRADVSAEVWLAVAMAALVIVGGRVALALLRQNGRLLLRIDALESALAEAAPPTARRQPAPKFQLPGVHGETLTLASLLAPGKPLLLLFTDPGCGPCNSLMPDVARWQQEGAFTTAVISRGSVDENRAKAVEHGVSTMLLQDEREVALSYGAAVTPCAVIVDAEGFIGGKTVCGPDAIRSLAAAYAPPARRGLAEGTTAPPIRLSDLDGREVELAPEEGPTLVLFWSPTCGFCQRMLPALQAWEENPADGAPKLLVVSTGTVEANRAQGVRAPVLIAPTNEVMRSYQASGTPMAVLIDTDGRIASPLAVGQQEVMTLAAKDTADR